MQSQVRYPACSQCVLDTMQVVEPLGKLYTKECWFQVLCRSKRSHPFAEGTAMYNTMHEKGNPEGRLQLLGAGACSTLSLSKQTVPLTGLKTNPS